MAEKKTTETFTNREKFGTKDKPSAEPVVEKVSSERDIIKYLEENQTNFVFLVGKSGRGKTAIVAAILNYLSTQTQYYVEVLRSEDNNEGTKLLLELRDAFKNQEFPGRTDVTKPPFNLDINFFTRDANGNPTKGVPITFVEMSGEHLEAVQLLTDRLSVLEQTRAKGKLPTKADVYFKAANLSMLFLFVTTPESARDDDAFMNQFLDYISNKDAKYREAYSFLAITQYDKYKSKTDNLSIQDFIEKRMPLSHSRFHNRKNRFGYFSVGEVVVTDEDTDQPKLYIKTIHDKYPKQVFSWIYETITKRELEPTSFLDQWLPWLKF